MITIKLIARNSKEMQFERVADGEIFIYPMTQLVLQSRSLVETYPNLGLIGKEVGESGVSFEDTYIEQLREGIHRVDDKIKSLSVDFKTTQSTTEKRTIVRKLEILKAEQLELESKIAERE